MLYCFKIKTDAPGFTDITEAVKKAVILSGVSEGVCVVNAADPCAAVVFGETGNEKAQEDILSELNTVIPPRADYGSLGDPFICAARTKAALAGASKELVVNGGNPRLAPGRSVCVVDFAGARTIEVQIKCI